MNQPLKSEVSIRVSDDGSTHLAGLPMFAGNDGQLLQEIDARVKSGARSLVVTANVDQALDLSSSAALWKAYMYASIRTLDGMPLVWMARLLGARNAKRQTGADLLIKCVAASRERGWRIAILGGDPVANATAVKRLRGSYPDADVVGMDLPYAKNFRNPETLRVTHELGTLRPNIVFICLGSPKQETFLMELMGELPPAVYIGAGAAVDFAAGTKSRAPELVQAAGLEWAWRLMQEPRRLASRYLIKGAGVGTILYNSIKGKKS